MKTIKIANKEYVFIEVPDDAYDFKIWGNNVLSYLEKSTDTNFNITSFKNTKIITTTNSITEEIAGNLLSNTYNGKYYRYVKDGTIVLASLDSAYPYNTALESFYSLMDSLELDRNNKNYLLIEKL